MNRILSKHDVPGAVRTFLAVELPPACRAKLRALQAQFADGGSILKMVSPDLIHITVRFLGGVPQARLAALEEAARRAAARVEPFRLTLSGPGAFPNDRAPRVLWVGLERDEGYASLQRLFEVVEDELAARAFSREERRFSPHVTLARTRDTAASGERHRLGEMLARTKARHAPLGSFGVDALVVMRSDLSPHGPAYTPMATLPLGVRS